MALTPRERSMTRSVGTRAPYAGSSSSATQAGGASVACTGACWARMGWGAAQAVAVRDVLARADNGTAVGGFSRVVRASATVLVRLQAAPE